MKFISVVQFKLWIWPMTRYSFRNIIISNNSSKEYFFKSGICREYQESMWCKTTKKSKNELHETLNRHCHQLKLPAETNTPIRRKETLTMCSKWGEFTWVLTSFLQNPKNWTSLGLLGRHCGRTMLNRTVASRSYLTEISSSVLTVRKVTFKEAIITTPTHRKILIKVSQLLPKKKKTRIC